MDDGVLWKNTLQSISENGLISNWVWNMFSIIPAFFMSRLTVWHSVNIIFSLCHIQSTGLSDFSCCKCPLPTLKLEVQADTWLWRKNKVTRDVFERGSDSFGMFCRNEICPYSRFLDVVGNSEAGSKKRMTRKCEGGDKNLSPKRHFRDIKSSNNRAFFEGS